jgi:hypothetical protein
MPEALGSIPAPKKKKKKKKNINFCLLFKELNLGYYMAGQILICFLNESWIIQPYNFWQCCVTQQ